MTSESPTLDDIAEAGARRKRDTDRLRQSTEALKEVVLAALRDGEHKPTEVTKASGWTAAHVRKMARDAGIEPDERYKDRAERLRKTSARPASSEETTG